LEPGVAYALGGLLIFMEFSEFTEQLLELKIQEMKNSIKLIMLFFVSIVAVGCKKEDKSPSYHKGEMTILTDESFKSVTEALAEGYMINYPETKIKVTTKKEDLGFIDLLNNKVRIAVMSRDLTPEEIKEYEKQIELKFLPAKFAADAVIFVVPKDSPKERSQWMKFRKDYSLTIKNLFLTELIPAI
jgi:ABC-type phosphate transport system substrate-binding protein